jgi:pyruvate-ferredoxin/flavodoxin oxidoreductase
MSVPVKDNLTSKSSVKGSQFAQPYIQFSGACAGCGETPYIKLITQLFGERMMIANATGCSSIWGASAPSTPYCKDANGRGPSWGNSLFEDNAEYGLGMATGVKHIREKLTDLMNEAMTVDMPQEFKDAYKAWLDGKDDADASKAAAEKVISLVGCCCKLNGRAAEIAKEIAEKKDYLVKKSVWILGGDGWAYDIGYGGLDHVLASGENVNVLVFDTEVYSNTGGQSSKSTPTGAVAKFAASGKKMKKKDLGMIATTYGYVYVAQVGMGADKNQLLKALVEAEKYNGPSLIIAYAPCINHGIKEGMGRTQANTAQAVDAGYWHLWRYNPELKKEGKNPFVLDSKEPKASFKDFLMGQVRYASLVTTFPDEAEELFARAEEVAKEKYENYKKMAESK